MADEIKSLLQKYVRGINHILQEKLYAVILYGSYARGDYREDSDIDIMILVNMTEEGIQKIREEVSYFTYDFNMEYDLELMPIIKSIGHYNYWKGVYPFYQNIDKEGVKLYVS